MALVLGVKVQQPKLAKNYSKILIFSIHICMKVGMSPPTVSVIPEMLMFLHLVFRPLLHNCCT